MNIKDPKYSLSFVNKSKNFENLNRAPLPINNSSKQPYIKKVIESNRPFPNYQKAKTNVPDNNSVNLLNHIYNNDTKNHTAYNYRIKK